MFYLLLDVLYRINVFYNYNIQVFLTLVAVYCKIVAVFCSYKLLVKETYAINICNVRSSFNILDNNSLLAQGVGILYNCFIQSAEVNYRLSLLRSYAILINSVLLYNKDQEARVRSLRRLAYFFFAVKLVKNFINYSLFFRRLVIQFYIQFYLFLSRDKQDSYVL